MSSSSTSLGSTTSSSPQPAPHTHDDNIEHTHSAPHRPPRHRTVRPAPPQPPLPPLPPLIDWSAMTLATLSDYMLRPFLQGLSFGIGSYISRYLVYYLITRYSDYVQPMDMSNTPTVLVAADGSVSTSHVTSNAAPAHSGTAASSLSHVAVAPSITNQSGMSPVVAAVALGASEVINSIANPTPPTQIHTPSPDAHISSQHR